MNVDSSSIDPNLRDTVPALRPPPSYPPPAATPSDTKRPPASSTTPQSPYQQHLQQYAPYPPDGPYNHAYFGPPPGNQYGPVQPSNGFPSLAPPGNAPPGLHYVSTRGGDAKRLRACEACRGLKVRCEPDPSGGPCKRCLKAGRKCEITPPSRKRQKKTDSRVSELEKQLADIQAQLKMRRQTIGSDSEGEAYSDANLISLVTPDRHNVTQTPQSQPSRGVSETEPSDPSINLSAQNSSRRYLDADIGTKRPLETAMSGPPNEGGPSVTAAPSNRSLLQAPQMFNSIGIIASSVEDELGVDLLNQYTRLAMPHNPKTDSVINTQRFQLLRHSKPILFVAIMLMMLQVRCKDGSLPPQLDDESKFWITKDDGTLHASSEAAMGSGGKKGNDGDGHNNDTKQLETQMSNPAHAFFKRIRHVDGKELEKETWFEEMLHGFQ